MKEIKPVIIKNGSFNFCKYTIALLLWLSVVLQNKLLVVATLIILMLSAILRVKNAPLVWLYTYTIEKLIPSKEIMVDENSVLFAHSIGLAFSVIAVYLLYLINPLAGWIVTGILAILKTSGAFGLCGAMKLYSCLNNPNGKCCRMGKKIKEL